jgi:hypothetical protein
MGLTKDQQMPELWALKHALLDSKTLLIEHNAGYVDAFRLEGILLGYDLVIKWIDQFFEDSPKIQAKVQIDIDPSISEQITHLQQKRGYIRFGEYKKEGS